MFHFDVQLRPSQMRYRDFDNGQTDIQSAS
jgi:hypothetical protein